VHKAGSAEGDGLALRFPRMVSIRTDKSPEQATTSAEIIKLFNQQRHLQLTGGTDA
jgi:DNA ligase-1